MAVLVGSETMAATTLSAVVVPALGVGHLEGVERLKGSGRPPPCWAARGVISLQVPDHAASTLELTPSLARRVPVYRVTMAL